MAKTLIFTKTFKKNYKKLPAYIQKQCDNKLRLFVQNAFHPSLQVHKYNQKKNNVIWEAYITKNYRFTFEITETECIIRNIGHHSIIDKGYV